MEIIWVAFSVAFQFCECSFGSLLPYEKNIKNFFKEGFNMPVFNYSSTIFIVNR